MSNRENAETVSTPSRRLNRRSSPDPTPPWPRNYPTGLTVTFRIFEADLLKELISGPGHNNRSNVQIILCSLDRSPRRLIATSPGNPDRRPATTLTETFRGVKLLAALVLHVNSSLLQLRRYALVFDESRAFARRSRSLILR